MEVRAWMSNYIPQKPMDAITYPCVSLSERGVCSAFPGQHTNGMLICAHCWRMCVNYWFILCSRTHFSCSGGWSGNIINWVMFILHVVRMLHERLPKANMQGCFHNAYTWMRPWREWLDFCRWLTLCFDFPWMAICNFWITSHWWAHSR